MLRLLKLFCVVAVTGLAAWVAESPAQVPQPDAEAKAAAMKKIKNQSVDPEGEPAEFYKTDIERYAVWRDRGTWHLRLTGARQSQHFKGHIRLEGGSFDLLSSYRSEKEKAAPEFWKLNPSRQELKFDFKTNRGLDGIRFRLSPETRRIVFVLEINGRTDPRIVYLGRKSQHPEVIPFALPAR
jgi:hypothetical protein